MEIGFNPWCSVLAQTPEPFNPFQL